MTFSTTVFTSIALIFAFSSCLVQCATVTYDWNITWVNANPDGRLVRPVVGINGKWPLPTVEVTLGDRVIVNVNNQLGNETTSLHWHGLHQNGSNYMDGPPGVTQCEIPSGVSFTYNFTVDQVGSYWYHTHTMGQLSDGLRGAFIIHDPNSPYAHQYSEELVVTLSDWYHDQAPYLLPRYLSATENPDGAEPVPYSALIGDAQNTPFNVKPCTGYLVRLINIGAFGQSYVTFDEHEMTIVAVDGVYVQPRNVSSVYITVAQRYDVIINTKCNADKNYAFLSSLDESAFDDVPSYLEPNVTGYLVYDQTKPMPEMPTVQVFNTTDDFTLVPADNEALLGKPDQEITLDLNFFTQDNQNRAGFNNITYLPQKVPSMYTSLTTGQDAFNPLVYGVNANPFVLKYNNIIEVTINNYDDGIHPIHVHGHQPQIVERVENVFTGSAKRMAKRHGRGRKSLTNSVVSDKRASGDMPPVPMRRDTWTVPALGYVKIRFQANNPGNWLIHCHMEWHIDAGLTATLIEAPYHLQKKQTVPQSMIDICHGQKVPTTGNAAGNTNNFLDLHGANTVVPTGSNGTLA